MATKRHPAHKQQHPDLSALLKALPFLTQFPIHKLWLDYDEEADVLYVSFRRPQDATDSYLGDDGVLHRYRDGELVGVTIFDVSTRRIQ